jgi:hypothetical protein
MSESLVVEKLVNKMFFFVFFLLEPPIRMSHIMSIKIGLFTAIGIRINIKSPKSDSNRRSKCKTKDYSNTTIPLKWAILFSMFMFFVSKYHNKKSQIRCCHCEKDLENAQPLPIPYRFTHKWKTLEWSHYFTEKEVLSHKTSLTPPCFESEQSCICVLWVSILCLSTTFGLDCGTVLTVWNLFVLHFIIEHYNDHAILR